MNSWTQRVERALRSRTGSAIQLVAGPVVLACVLRAVDIDALEGLGRRFSVVTGAGILVAALLAHALGAVRFKLICDPVKRLGVKTHLQQYFIGACFGLFLPSSMGGDGVRILLLARSGARGSEAGSLVIVERALGAVSLLAISGSAAMAGAVSGTLRRAVIVATVACIGIASGVAVLSARIHVHWEPIESALATVRRTLRRDQLLVVFATSVAYQAACVTVTALVGLAADLPVRTSAIFALTPLVWFVTLLPISVGGLGVREAAFVALFGQVGVTSEHAVLLSLGTYAGLVAVGVVGAIWFLWDRISGVLPSVGRAKPVPEACRSDNTTDEAQ